MRKFLFSILLLALPLIANAETVQIDGIWYQLIEKVKIAEVVSSTDGTKYTGDVLVPGKVTYNGMEYSVTSIGESAFYDCSSLTSITIPNSVTCIGNGAFSSCYSLSDISIPNSVTCIGNSAFSSCSSLSDISIPNSVTSIGSNAFSFCSSLTNIAIPYSVTSIGDQAFSNCSNLTSITIPNSVTSIGNDAFSFCSSLSDITIPNSVTSIGRYAFKDCSNLTGITIPNSVTSIGEQAFYSCSNLTNITISNSITSIGSAVFCGCSSLTNVTIPNSVTSIGRYAFEDCSSITTVFISSSVNSIGSKAFSNCKNLTDVYCNAEKVPTIESDAFLDAYVEYATLHVPDSSFYDYKEADVWKDFGTITTLSGNIPAYTHNLIYMVDGVEYKKVAMDYKTAITLDAAPTKEGHTFSGWSEAPVTMPLRDVVVIGSFIPNIYTLNYVLNNQIFKTESITYGTAIVTPEATAKEGHTFTGWGEVPATMPANNVTLTGTYTPNNYTVTYMVDNAVFKTDTITYGHQVTVPQTPIKEGYTFSGWSEAPETMPANDVVINGSFTINNYNLVYLVDSVEYKKYEVTYGDTLATESEPTKEGYTFSGWSEIPITMPANDVTVKGTFNVNYYLVTYMVDSAVYAVDTLDYGSNITLKENLTKEGYTFSGWSEVPTRMPANDIVVSGSFTINTYNLTYNVDGVEYKKYEVSYGDTLIAEAEPIKEGYTFNGWSEIPATMPANDVTIEGTFNVNTYQVIYILDGEIFQIDSLAYGASVVIPEAPAKEDYEFNGWSETPETMPANNLTVTGTYTLLVYCDTPTISFKDGKLMYECTTEGATCVTNIVSDDFMEHMGNEMELTLTYQVNVYAKAEGYAKSPVATATICWIECDHKSDAHGVEAIPATVVLIKASNGTITIEGLETDTQVAVYATSGTEVANGVAEEDATLTLETNLQKGDIAIVKMGIKSVKVVVK